MIIIQGKSVFGGIAIGRLSVYSRSRNLIKRIQVDNPEPQIRRFETAKNTAKNQLKTLFNKAMTEAGEENAAIFKIHQMILDDLEYNESVQNIIRTQQVNAEYAVGVTADHFAAKLSSMEDNCMQARAADIRDISKRVVSILGGKQQTSGNYPQPIIVAADYLAPSETIQLDKENVLGVITVHGSSNSHTAILARTMNIPAITHAEGIDDPANDGKYAIIDGYTGTAYIDPDDKTTRCLLAKLEEDRKRKRLLEALKGLPSVTKSGQEINLFANIGHPSDVGAVLQNDAGGIGLFRSEFLYLEGSDYPTEQEQFTAYKTIVQHMAGKPVVIRTLDIGADKKAGYFGLEPEENPALGCRAIRLCLSRPEVFKTQLRALYRASAFGNLAIMFPMIISVEEIRQIKAITAEVKEELKSQSIPYAQNIELGIMIETPAAAMVSDLLAKEVDFFSVGTNDLTQYTLAIDRQNQALKAFYDPHHKALLRLIHMAAENAHKNGRWIGVCGELGADPELLETFLAMGIDELSVSPGCILELRQQIRKLELSETRKQQLINQIWS